MEKEYVLPFTGIEIEEKLKEADRLSENNEFFSSVAETLELMAAEISEISSAISTEGVETITLTINNSNWDGGKVRYTDKNYNFNELEISASPDYHTNGTLSTYTIECIKGSFIVFSGYGFKADIEPNFNVDYNSDGEGLQVYYFNADATINVEDGESW